MDVGLEKQVYIETVVEIVYYNVLSLFYFTVAETEQYKINCDNTVQQIPHVPFSFSLFKCV